MDATHSNGLSQAAIKSVITGDFYAVIFDTDISDVAESLTIDSLVFWP